MISSANTTKKRRLAVIGGGISGLAAAHRLVELERNLDLTLFEAADRLGGVLETVRDEAGFLVEKSADNFITNLPWARDLCRRVGLANQLISTEPTNRQALVVCRGRLAEVPAGFVLMAPREMRSVVESPILSWAGKLRLAWEFFESPRLSESDESVAAFTRRRMGREVFDRLVQPLIGGIYTADPEKLSMAATMPQFVAMERSHGSLIRAAWKQNHEPPAARPGATDSGARYSLFMAPRAGMSSLVDAIAARLPAGAARLSTRVTRLARETDGRWTLSFTTRDGQEQRESFDGVVVATPAPRAADLLAPVDERLASDVGAIEYAGASIVILAYPNQRIGRPLTGFGFVVPAIEKRKILSVSYASRKYAGRAPESHTLLRVFVGGALQPELADLPDDALLETVRRELADLLDVRGEPSLVRIVRYRQTMPQYHVGHLTRVADIETRAARYPGLALAGNGYRGVGVPQCIRSGELAAERILGYFPAS